MADQSDVETALVNAIAQAIYPEGPGFPGVISAPCRIYRGWPDSAALDNDLKAGWVNISVFPLSVGMRNTTRYMDFWQLLADQPPTLGVDVTGTTATFSGTAQAGQLAGLLVNNSAFVYLVQATDTPASVAAALAAKVAGMQPASTNGASVTVPGAYRLIGRVVAPQPALWQTRRQEQNFRVTLWCPDPLTRDAAASAIDAEFAQAHFLQLADGSLGRLLFQSSTALDNAEVVGLYRRDLLYSVEYPTTRIQTLPTMLFANITIGSAIATFGTLTG
ncbi:MAG: hypothetical protein K6U10_10445 [Acidobacteriia bacterium]|nr:hypothetical protein [Methyloceanibacter sp.]MCL6492226.1 hypothetical protein [Terriglobia bacterium]